MFDLIILCTFTILLQIANVYCFIKKKYLYLFVPCMLFLPDYYGFEISSLPLITASRIMYVIFYIYAWLNRRRNIDILEFRFKELPKEYLFLAGYFVLRLITNFYYVSTYGQAVKTILIIIFEHLFLLLAVYILAPKKEEIIALIKVIVWAATFLFVMGIIQSIISENPFYALYTIGRNLYVCDYYRLGLLRATATMYAPSIYGNMCILMLPFILYLYEIKLEKRYLLILGLDILALIHSGSRADILFLFVVIFTYFIYVLKGKDRRIQFLKNAGVVIAAFVIYIGIACLCSPGLKYYYLGTAKSLLNEVGFDFDLSEGAPESNTNFGENQDGSISRIRQFTGMYYVAKRNPIFGMGSGAPQRGDVQVYWHFSNGTDKWFKILTYDVGIVEIFCDEGIVGLLGVCSLLVYIFIKSRGNKFFKLAIICYMLTALSAGNMYAFLFTYVIAFDQLVHEKKPVI